MQTIGQVRLTRKTSLCTAASEEVLPAKLDQVSEGLILNGYVASITGDAIFVRFLDDLTGRAGLAQLADTFVADPHTLFTLGQSVRAQVVQLDSAKGRFTLTLKQSVCGLTDGLFLKSLFEDKEACHALDSEADASIDWNAFAPGNVGTYILSFHENKQLELQTEITHVLFFNSLFFFISTNYMQSREKYTISKTTAQSATLKPTPILSPWQHLTNQHLIQNPAPPSMALSLMLIKKTASSI